MRRIWKGALIGGAVGTAVAAAQVYRREGESQPGDVRNHLVRSGLTAAMVGGAVGFVLDRRDGQRGLPVPSLSEALAGAGAVADTALPVLQHAADVAVRRATETAEAAADAARPKIQAAADAALPLVQAAADTVRQRASDAAGTAMPHVTAAAETAKGAKGKAGRAAEVALERAAARAADLARPRDEAGLALARLVDATTGDLKLQADPDHRPLIVAV